jgi:hypothetical protein
MKTKFIVSGLNLIEPKTGLTFQQIRMLIRWKKNWRAFTRNKFKKLLEAKIGIKSK